MGVTAVLYCVDDHGLYFVVDVIEVLNVRDLIDVIDEVDAIELKAGGEAILLEVYSNYIIASKLPQTHELQRIVMELNKVKPIYVLQQMR